MAIPMLALMGLTTLASYVSSTDVGVRLFNWDEIKHLVAFGDSYTYVQGTAGYPGFSFMGSWLPGNFSFTPEMLLLNEIVQSYTSTAEGGPNWIECLSGCGLESGETRPQSCEMQLWDFAFAGAQVSEEFLTRHHPFTIQLVEQTHQYLTWAEPVIGKEMDKSKALVAIWIGINDISDSATFSNVSFPAFYDQLIDAVFERSVQPLYDAGYQNFLFVNQPPRDRAPGNLEVENPMPNKTMIEWWDDSLSRHSEEFVAWKPAVKAMVYDANTFLNGVLDEPGRYGIKNTTSYCEAIDEPDVEDNPEKYGCLPLDQYFWFDSGHMSSQVHKVMAPDMAKFLREQSTNGV